MTTLYTFVTGIAIILLIILLVIAYLIMRKFISTMAKFVEQKAHKVLTVLKCPVCGYIITREYKQGDYVGALTNEYCPRDHHRLIITDIYREISVSEKE